ncbi:DUF2637 domain-containing protein [Prescottella agglutinans]|uniref:DNA-binding CsgD family transcriptional regulator n=1 Tax=Prescottella agglutinans TaxID=1644129 RepID=A0ABT6MFX2_9NOCA|nr:DUF2637 domain-containing protein [Prescottella agglutinans]MDH6282785.1 DNA-binding CsgD family transcriptional regulator [Prescottella agglutinans]
MVVRSRSVDEYIADGIAVVAFVFSYGQLAELAGRAGYGGLMSHLWPIAVDGLAVIATRSVSRLLNNRYAWLLLASATAVSVVAAASAHLLPPGPLPPVAAAAVAVVPPLCLLAAPHLAVQISRESRSHVAPVADGAEAVSDVVVAPVAVWAVSDATQDATSGDEDVAAVVAEVVAADVDVVVSQRVEVCDHLVDDVAVAVNPPSVDLVAADAVACSVVDVRSVAVRCDVADGRDMEGDATGDVAVAVASVPGDVEASGRSSPKLSQAERRAEVMRLVATGMEFRPIARRLGCSDMTVRRDVEAMTKTQRLGGSR